MSHTKITTKKTKVCILNKETNMIMRVSREFAVNAIVRFPNIYRYTTKNALKKFMGRDMQIKKNDKFIAALINNKKHKYHNYKVVDIREGNRQYMIIGGGIGQRLVKSY